MSRAGSNGGVVVCLDRQRSWNGVGLWVASGLGLRTMADMAQTGSALEFRVFCGLCLA